MAIFLSPQRLIYRIKIAAQGYCSQHITPNMLEKISQRRALKSARRLIMVSPAYREILLKKSGKVDRIKNLNDFQDYLPLLDKYSFFRGFAVSELLDDFSDLETFIVSSGTSGNFSVGLKSAKELAATAQEADFSLSSFFKLTSKDKPFIVNALAMGTRVFTNLFPQSVIGPHPRRVLETIRIAADLGYAPIFVTTYGHLLLKQIIELGHQLGFPWKEKSVIFLTGGEHLPENSRQYFYRYIGDKDEKRGIGKIFSTGGVTELRLNSLFFEMPELVQIRSLAISNRELRNDLFLSPSRGLPALMAWNPLTSYIELTNVSDGLGQFAFTNLDKTAILPLTRYVTGDWGRIIKPDSLAQILSKHGISELLPKIPFPIVTLLGRDIDHSQLQREIQEALYADFDVAMKITGNFKTSMTSADKGTIQVQLKAGELLDNEMKSRLSNIINNYTSQTFTVEPIGYYNFEHYMSLDFENKFN
jgi:phenylacetate-CoA ligase